MVRILATAFLITLMLGAVGCGSSNGMVPVTGTVTMDGKPAAKCEVTFTPQQGRPGSAVTDDQGNFTLSTIDKNDGGVVGHHKVTICEHYPAGQAPPMGDTLPSRFPAKYADPTQSPFTADVERDKKNHFTFEMKKEG